MDKTASIRRDSLFLAVFHIQQKALNLKWKTTSMRAFRRKLSHLKWEKSTAAFETERSDSDV
jgi:hypothetical protein